MFTVPSPFLSTIESVGPNNPVKVSLGGLFLVTIFFQEIKGTFESKIRELSPASLLVRIVEETQRIPLLTLKSSRRESSVSITHPFSSTTRLCKFERPI